MMSSLYQVSPSNTITFPSILKWFNPINIVSEAPLVSGIGVKLMFGYFELIISLKL